MPFTVPDSWGSDLREENKCHLPAGAPESKGGQFCSKKGWHLTADPNFKPDPARKPLLNRVFLSDLMTDPKDLPSGLFVTDSPEYWMQAHGYERPYVAQVQGRLGRPQAGAARVANEDFLQGDVEVLRVLTIDEYAREVFGEPGWVEDYFAPARRYGEAPKRFPKGYVGRSVSEMSPAEIKEWERKFKEWTNRKR